MCGCWIGDWDGGGNGKWELGIGKWVGEILILRSGSGLRCIYYDCNGTPVIDDPNICYSMGARAVIAAYMVRHRKSQWAGICAHEGFYKI